MARSRVSVAAVAESKINTDEVLKTIADKVSAARGAGGWGRDAGHQGGRPSATHTTVWLSCPTQSIASKDGSFYSPPKSSEKFFGKRCPRVCVSLTLFPLAITRRSPRSLRAVGGHREQVRRDHLRRGRRGARVAVRHRRRRHQLHPRGKSDWVFRPPQAPWFSQANPAARKVFTDKISQ